MKLFAITSSLILWALLPSCSPFMDQLETTASGRTYMNGYNNPSIKSEIPWDMRLGQGHWDDPGNLQGTPRLIINRPEQKAYFYKGDTIVGMTPISTGSEGHDTPAGQYKVLEKKIMHYSSTWGVAKNKSTGEIVMKDFSPKQHKMPTNCVYEPAKMPYSLRIHGGYFMHVGYVPGYAASHGCIRVPEDMAKKFWDNAYVGLPVTII